MLKSNIIQLQ